MLILDIIVRNCLADSRLVFSLLADDLYQGSKPQIPEQI